MSLVITIAVVIAALVSGIGFLVFRRHTWWVGIAGGAILLAVLVWFLHPVCRAISEEEVVNFDPPIDIRTATNMIGQPVFQKRDGRWFHCKSWIARQLFF